MTIRVNGEALEIAGPVTISGLLANLTIDSRLVAVEHNLSIVKRDKYRIGRGRRGRRNRDCEFRRRRLIRSENPEPGTRNPEPGTRNTEPGTGNRKPQNPIMLTIADKTFRSRLIVGLRQVPIAFGDGAGACRLGHRDGHGRRW